MTGGIEKQADTALFAIAGPGDIREISAIQGRLAAAIAAHDGLVLDLSGVETPDITFAQLIEACRNTAEHTGKSLSLSRPADGELAALLERGGFLAQKSSRSFWLKEDAR